jgi:adenine-specific DNA-methyltransferase
MAKKIADGFVEFSKNKFGKWVAYEKIYAPTEDELSTKKYTTWIDYISNGTQTIKDIFGSPIFEYPKSPELISHFIKMGDVEEDSIVLDFFSGSATTAHAVMQLNAEDGGHRKFIMVQLPEVCEEGTEAAKAGYKNICEIGKERIRRAARKIREENSLTTQNQDLGFKVFKLDTSNIIPWNPEPDKIELLLRNAVENILVGRTRQDLLYEVLLKCNLPLTLPIEERKFGGNTVYIVGAGALAICLDTKIPQTIAEEIVKLRDEYAPIVPMQVVFRDNGFTDVTKTNALQILKQAGFEEKSVQTI